MYSLTPLHLAATKGNPIAIEALIRLGADVNSPDRFSLTPIHYASIEGSISSLKILLENGANINSRNDNNKNC